jgi:transcriptional regulator with XRE-family HTH domain
LTGFIPLANILAMTLDEYLTQNDLTETEFARLVGCSQGTINKLRNGKTNPTMTMLQAISRATDGAVTPNDFLPEQEPAPSRPFRDEGAPEAASVEADGDERVSVASEEVRAAE